MGLVALRRPPVAAVIGLSVTAITPAFGPESGGTAIANLAGTGFAPGATVSIGGAAATDVVVASPTQITCTAPPGTFGSADVVVTNPDAQSSGASGNGVFAYYALVDFAALADGTMSQEAFLSATGLSTFTRADSTPPNAVTVQDSATTVLSGIGPNVARLYNDGARRGLLLEQRTQNRAPGTGDSPRDITADWSATDNGTQTAASGTSPDGQTNASRVTLPGFGLSNYASLGSATYQPFVFSSWQRSYDASTDGNMQASIIRNSTDTWHTASRAASDAWARLVLPKGFDIEQYVFPVDARDRTAWGGDVQQARDVLVDFMQIETGTLATSCITKGGGVREPDLAEWAMPTAGNRLRLYARLYPLFDSLLAQVYDFTGDVDAVESRWYLYESTASATYLYIDANSKQVFCSVASAAEVVAAVQMAWSAFDDLEILVEVGDSTSTTLRYRTNGGSWIDLGMLAIPGDATPTNVTLMSSASPGAVFPCLLRELRSYPVEIVETDL